MTAKFLTTVINQAKSVLRASHSKWNLKIPHSNLHQSGAQVAPKIWSIWTPKAICFTSWKSLQSKKNMGTSAHPWYLKLPWRSRARAQCDSPASGFLWCSTEQQVAAVNVLNVASPCVRPWKTKRASGSMPNTLRAWSLHNWAPPTCLTWEFSPSPAGLRSQDGKRGGKKKKHWSCFLSIVAPELKVPLQQNNRIKMRGNTADGSKSGTKVYFS